ncbi:hypothetical protein [Pseudocolwellia agarivorans]|uniref:hypothetical protein n=1 Tax=Pseudocolwellia agarivorans TaxID=1911682 RepID=UPI000985044B|nr:hypothetical protein [Pseudocolwellia agarivorans]
MKHILLITCLAILFTGCTSTSKLEDYANNPNGMWAEGKKLSEKGEALISKGEKVIENARIKANQGEALIQSSNDAIIRARQDYQLEAAKSGRSTSPKEVEYEAERLAAIGEKWEKAISNVNKGKAAIAQSKKAENEGQEQIEKGRQLVEQGTNFIRNSQKMRLEQTTTTL